jgi:hypothetical protein
MTSKRKEAVVDPVVASVQQSYEENLTFFMSSVSSTLKRYNEMLQTALPHNPKAVFFFDAPADPSSPTEVAAASRKTPRSASVVPGVKEPTSPLLRRPKLDPLVVADMEANAIQLLQQQSSMHYTSNSHHGDFMFPKLPHATEALPVGAAPAQKEKVISFAVGSRRPREDKKHLTAEQLEVIAMPPLLLVQLRVIKQEARSLGKVLDQVHDWIALNVPMMKEEDNMGVAVMASVISEVSGCISRVRNVYDIEASYVSDRSESELKYLKAMDADSAIQAIKVIDTDTWDTLEKGWRVLMRVVLMVHTTLARNMRILRDPRTAPKHHLSL